jgi:hypothetical protein
LLPGDDRRNGGCNQLPARPAADDANIKFAAAEGESNGLEISGDIKGLEPIQKA